MEIPVGKCSSCGKMVNMWRCGDVPGGGTYHIVCFECSKRDSQNSGQATASWQWIGWLFVIGFMIATVSVILFLSGR